MHDEQPHREGKQAKRRKVQMEAVREARQIAFGRRRAADEARNDSFNRRKA